MVSTGKIRARSRDGDKIPQEYDRLREGEELPAPEQNSHRAETHVTRATSFPGVLSTIPQQTSQGIYNYLHN